MVLYGYGGLEYSGPGPRYVVHDVGSMALAGDAAGVDGYAFEGESLVTDQQPTNARLKILNSEEYDPARPGSWAPADYQTFLVDRFDYWNIRLGWAAKKAKRAIVLQASRVGYGTVLTTRVEMIEEGNFLRGEGSTFFGSTFFTPGDAAIWTMSFLATAPRAGNETI